jgi:hypothetical protein
MCGIDPDQFGATFADYEASVHPDDRQAMSVQLDAFRRSQASEFDFSHRIVRPDGSVIHILGGRANDNA